MNRPEVRIIEPQSEESRPVEVSGWEAEQLLRKYGHQDQSFSTRPQVQQPEQPGLTFDQMIAQEEASLKQEQLRKHQQMMAPKPVTFNGRNGYDSEVRYGSDSDSGFGFKIEIATDMNLPKY
jgi:hypothetical protein